MIQLKCSVYQNTLPNMQNALIRFRDIPNVKLTLDNEMADRGVAERLSMPWLVIRQYKNYWATDIPIDLTLDDVILKATIVSNVPIVSTCPIVIYSCQVIVDDSDMDNIKVTVTSPMVPRRFQMCGCKTTSKSFELCSCLVLHLFNMATNDVAHDKTEADIALGICKTLTRTLENVKADETHSSPYTNWTKRGFLFPYDMLYRISLMNQGCNVIKEPSKLVSAYFDFTMFCQTYEQVDLYFSLCCYMQPARARLFMDNTKVAYTLLKKIQDDPLRAFLGQLIEVEGLRQAAIDAESGDVKKLIVITDAELHAAVHIHEELLCESLLRGTSDVQLYAESIDLKLLAWMGGILVDHGNPIGRLAMASLAERDCVARLQKIASYWHPRKLLPAHSLDQHLQTTHLLFVNTRGTVGRTSPYIKPTLEIYRKNGLVTLAPSDVSALEERFDDLCRSLEHLYNANTRHPVIPVVTIVDLHLFSPLMLRTILTFLLECQHGFKYNDIVSPKTYRATRTSLPFKFLFFGDFASYSFRGGIQIVNQFLDLGANRDCFYRDSLQDVFVNQDHYAKYVQLGMRLENSDIDQIPVEDVNVDAPLTMFRVYVDGWKTRLYRSTMPLPEKTKDDNEFIGRELCPTTIHLPFSSVHLATVNPKHIYTALSMTAGDVVLHVPEAEMVKLAVN